MHKDRSYDVFIVKVGAIIEQPIRTLNVWIHVHGTYIVGTGNTIQLTGLSTGTFNTITWITSYNYLGKVGLPLIQLP